MSLLKSPPPNASFTHTTTTVTSMTVVMGTPSSGLSGLASITPPLERRQECERPKRTKTTKFRPPTPCGEKALPHCPVVDWCTIMTDPALRCSRSVYFRHWFEDWESKNRLEHLLISWVRNAGIKVIAADFDLTMTSIHSGGYVLPTDSRAPRIFSSLSPEWQSFATRANAVGIRISCVTYSDSNSGSGGIGGEALVRTTLRTSQATFNLESVYGFYPENYCTPDRYTPLGLSRPMPDDKSYHLRRLCMDYQVDPHEVLLIDDDEHNCIAAERDGYFTIHVSGGRGFTLRGLRLPDKFPLSQ